MEPYLDQRRNKHASSFSGPKCIANSIFEKSGVYIETSLPSFNRNRSVPPELLGCGTQYSHDTPKWEQNPSGRPSSFTAFATVIFESFTLRNSWTVFRILFLAGPLLATLDGNSLLHSHLTDVSFLPMLRMCCISSGGFFSELKSAVNVLEPTSIETEMAGPSIIELE